MCLKNEDFGKTLTAISILEIPLLEKGANEDETIETFNNRNDCNYINANS